MSDCSDRKLLTNAIQSRNASDIRLSISDSILNIPNRRFRTPLHELCASVISCGWRWKSTVCDIVKEMMVRGAAPSLLMKDDRGDTPVDLAYRARCVNLIALLHKYGVPRKYDPLDKYGWTTQEREVFFCISYGLSPNPAILNQSTVN